jgi:hypothetical protein
MHLLQFSRWQLAGSLSVCSPDEKSIVFMTPISHSYAFWNMHPKLCVVNIGLSEKILGHCSEPPTVSAF